MLSMAPAEITCCGLNAHAGKRHKGPAMPRFPGFDLCPEDSAQTGEPYNSTSQRAAAALLQKMHNAGSVPVDQNVVLSFC